MGNKLLLEKYEFRNIRQDEVDQAAEIERRCFPANEACSYEHMESRIRRAPDFFLAAVDRKTGKLAGFLNGLATNRVHLADEFFTNVKLHDPNGENIMLLGLDVLPEHRGQGLARELMQQYLKREKKKGRKAVILTCKKEKIEMYEKFGFTDCEVGESVWGGELWYEMRIVWHGKEECYRER